MTFGQPLVGASPVTRGIANGELNLCDQAAGAVLRWVPATAQSPIARGNNSPLLLSYGAPANTRTEVFRWHSTILLHECVCSNLDPVSHSVT